MAINEEKFKNLPDKVAEQRKLVVEQVIEDMQKGDYEWIRPWSNTSQAHNPVTGTIYQGANNFSLTVIGWLRHYDDPRWVTFNQAKKLGLEWRPTEEIDYEGKRGVHIEKWKQFHYQPESDNPDKETETHTYFKCVGSFTVFNACEFTNFPPMRKPEPNTDHEIGELANDVIRSSRCPITETGNEAFYSPREDAICVPPRDTFKSNESFLVTLLHEMGHSTGHPSALNRPILNHFGSEAYAKEELVAELSSLFSARDLGIAGDIDTSSEHYTQHLAYLQSWIKALEDDPNLIFSAASVAEKASNLVINRYEKEVGHTAPGKAAIKEQLLQKTDEGIVHKQTSVAEKNKEVEKAQDHLPKETSAPIHETHER